MTNEEIAKTIREACQVITVKCFSRTPPDLDYATQMIEHIESLTRYISKGIGDFPRYRLEELAKSYGFRREMLGNTPNVHLVKFINESM